MYEPAANDEITGIVTLPRPAADRDPGGGGRADGASRPGMRPCRSALSIGGLLKHATYGMRGRDGTTDGRGAGRTEIDEAAFAAYMGELRARPTRRRRPTRSPSSTAPAPSTSRPSRRPIRTARPSSRRRRGTASTTPGRRTPATTSCTRSRRWPATPATPTSSASRSTASPSRRSCSAKRARRATTTSSRTCRHRAPSAHADSRFFSVGVTRRDRPVSSCRSHDRRTSQCPALHGFPRPR